MVQILTLIFAVAYGWIMVHFSARRTAKMMDANSRPLQDDTMDGALSRLARTLDIPQIKVHIYEIEPINGLAVPDGRIFITRGLYAIYQKGKISTEELLSVIAHELGHVALGHTRKRMVDFGSQNALRNALVMVFQRFIPFIGPMIAGFIMSALAAHLSRKAEFEADSYATALMIKAGFGAEAQKSMFRKLDALTKIRGATPAWFLSHPKTKDRIAAIEQNEARWDR